MYYKGDIMIKKTAIAIILILLIGVVILYGCTSNKDTGVKKEPLISKGQDSLEKIKQDQRYTSLSKNFQMTLSYPIDNKIDVNLNMVNAELQEYVGSEMENMIAGVLIGCYAILIDEYINDYDSIDIKFFDLNNKEFSRKILVKDEINGLKEMGYSDPEQYSTLCY